MAERTCPQCGTAFTWSKANQRYCSPVCAQISRKGSQLRTCEVCLTEFRWAPRNKSAGRCCSRECGFLLRRSACAVRWRECRWCARRYTTRGKRRCDCAPPVKPEWTPTTRTCQDCGAEFPTTNKFVSALDYCSRHCARKAGKRRRRAREVAQQCEWRWSDFMRIARKFNYCCAYCGEKPERLDPDHVMPLSRGGRDTVANLLPACPTCNGQKRDLTLAEWTADRTARALPPRHTSWAEGDERYAHLTLLAA